jgi:hypothetical protein
VEHALRFDPAANLIAEDAAKYDSIGDTVTAESIRPVHAA